MLYQYKTDGSLRPMEFYNFFDLGGTEKDLENLLGRYLEELFVEGEGRLMPIFQERPWQEEPDLCALDREGNLVLFELKCPAASQETTLQILRYAQLFGMKTYEELNLAYRAYQSKETDLATAHAQAFQLEHPLAPAAFNRRQKLIIVGNAMDREGMKAVDFWAGQGIDIDFLPYRFYKIGGETYFEFFAKPYDYQMNPSEQKGILFDTNRSYMENAVWEMLAEHKISAYGNAQKYVNRFRKGDYVFYYHAGFGVIAAGRVRTGTPLCSKDKTETYHSVELLTPTPKKEDEICSLSKQEIEELLDKRFYYATTAKAPYLSAEESKKLVDALNRKYQSNKK